MTERISEPTANSNEAPSPTAQPGGRDRIELRLPASSAYLAVARTAAAGLAARLNFTLDEIEDLRIAVDEACSLLLPKGSAATGRGHLDCVFDVELDALTITVSTTDDRVRPPSRDSFSWIVLTGLTGEVDTTSRDDGTVTISMRKTRRADQ